LTVQGLLLCLFVQRPVDEAQQGMVLPQAHSEHDPEGDRTHDQAGAQLLKVIDDAQSLVVADRPDCRRHLRLKLSPYCRPTGDYASRVHILRSFDPAAKGPQPRRR
jgi:hypothetical protein